MKNLLLVLVGGALLSWGCAGGDSTAGDSGTSNTDGAVRDGSTDGNGGADGPTGIGDTSGTDGSASTGDTVGTDASTDGSGGVDGSTGSNATFTCNYVIKTSQFCESIEWGSLPEAKHATYTKSCTQNNGTLVTTCPKDFLLGTCKYVRTVDGITFTQTMYFYGSGASLANAYEKSCNLGNESGVVTTWTKN